jgi:hypothetical protein
LQGPLTRPYRAVTPWGATHTAPYPPKAPSRPGNEGPTAPDRGSFVRSTRHQSVELRSHVENDIPQPLYRSHSRASVGLVIAYDMKGTTPHSGPCPFAFVVLGRGFAPPRGYLDDTSPANRGSPAGQVGLIVTTWSAIANVTKAWVSERDMTMFRNCMELKPCRGLSMDEPT